MEDTMKNNRHSATFWSWNGLMKKEEMVRQIEKFQAMGIGGFFMHSRTGLATPYMSDKWFELVRLCQVEAEKRGMEAWIYDEDRYPSGFAGGKVPAENPSCRLQEIFLGEEDSDLPMPPGQRIGRPFKSAEGKRYFFTQGEVPSWSWFNGESYIDGMNPLAAKKFIECTHEEYLAHCPKAFPGSFTDEPNYGDVCVKMDWMDGCCWYTTPYDERIRQTILKRYGYDLFDHLPEIFGLEKKDQFSLARMHYILVMTELFTNNFIKPLGVWHRRHKLTLTGHVMGEDSFQTQIHHYGDVMQAYPYFTMPGIDVLGDTTWNRLTTAQLRSVAHQYGKKECLAELYGATGWEFSAEAHKNHGDRLLLDGITFRCLHKSDYSLAGEAKRDYPASISFQLSWCSHYRMIEDYFQRMGDKLAGAEMPADILVLSPIESAWGHFGIEETDNLKQLDQDFMEFLQGLYGRQVAFDIGSEALLAQDGRVVGNRLFLKRAGYRAVVLPRMVTMRATTRHLLEQFAAEGGLIVAPFGISALEDGMLRKNKLKLPVKATLDVLDSFIRIGFSDSQATLFGSIFKKSKQEMLFVYNAGTSWKKSQDGETWKIATTPQARNVYPEISIDWKTEAKGIPCEYVAERDEYRQVACDKLPDGWRIRTSFDRLQSRLFVLLPGKQAPKELLPLEEKMVPVLDLPDELEYKLNEDNILLIDKFKCKDISDEPSYVLELDMKIRQSLGFEQRSGFMVQPWKQQERNNNVAIGRDVVLTATFKSTQDFDAELVMEDPERFEVTLNGVKLSADASGRWWFDPAFKCMTIPAGTMIVGENTLVLRTRYDRDHPGLEAVYLRGRFAVDAEKYELRALPARLPVGKDWGQVGLPFYQGSVSCFVPVVQKGKSFCLPRFSGTMVCVKSRKAKEQVLVYPPYVFEIPAGEKSIELELWGSPRNFLGPFFYDYPVYCSAPLLFWQNNVKKRSLYPFGWNV